MNHRHKVLIDVVAAVGLALVMALFTAGEQVSLAAGSIIYVDADATGAHDGTSWADAFTDLQPALDAAVSGDQIWVAEGTYTPTVVHGGKNRRFRSFQLENGVALYGGFDPTSGDITWEDRDWVSNLTILSGDLKGDDGPDLTRNRDNSYHVFYHPAEIGLAGTAILDGFTISGGNANHSDSPHNAGGGMYNVGASPTLTNCTFSGNWASIGGGMYNSEASSPTLSNCWFNDNSGNLGGGMLNSNSSPTLTSCVFSGNSADTGVGGGMYNDGSSPILTDCSFEENSATEGGGMRNFKSSPTLIACAFTRNSASYQGGGMENSDSSPVLTDCTFDGNTAVNQGGGMRNAFAAPVLTNVTFTANSATNNGGGIYNSSAAPILINSTFIENSATYGGGIYNANSSSPTLDNISFTGNQANDGAGIYNIDSSAPVLDHCVFSDNAAAWAGGGMQNIRSSPTIKDCIFEGNSAGISGGGMNNSDSSSPVVVNTIFWGNTAENGGGMHNYIYSYPRLTNCTFASNTATYGGAMHNYGQANPVLTNSILWGNTPDQINGDPATVTYSDVEGGYTGTSNIASDPQFLDTANGDFHLGPGSPCIDSGTNTALNLPPYDFEADARIIDGDGDGIATVDMGVDELDEPYPPIVFYVDQDATGANNGTSWADAFTTLQSALDATVSGDQIWVAEGIYKPANEFTPGDPRSAHFQMKNGVAIYGGFSGVEGSLEERNWQIHITVLSGDLNGDDGPDFSNNVENSYHVFYHPEGSALGPRAILDGFTIMGGNANHTTWPHMYGGGMHNNGSSPTLTNCKFTNNSAGSGGGLYNSYNSSPLIKNCSFENNLSPYGQGGGIYDYYYSSPVLISCTFNNNKAEVGGGMANREYSSPVMDNCVYKQNWAMSGGGVNNSSSSSPTMNNCTFQDNTAGNEGGGMRNDNYSSPTLNNCLFTGNNATTGGGIYNHYSWLTLTNCTFTGNTATNTGGGMHNYYSSTPTVVNSVLWGDLPNEISSEWYSYPWVSYSDVQGGYLGEGNIMMDPLFVDALNGDYHLSSSSACIDAGSNAAPHMLENDFEGDLRILDGNGDEVAIVDMGVDETYYVPQPSVIILVDQDATGANNGTSWIDAFTTLQPALDAAKSGDQIWVAEGTYLPTREFTFGDPRSVSFQMKNSVSIYGGFAGTESSLDERDWVANVTILSGDLNGDDGPDFENNTENSYHVFYHPESIVLNGSAIMDGFTIVAGNANGAYPHHGGGGMLNHSAYPVLANCTFANNAAWIGGGIYNLDSNPTITNVTFTGNSASYHGGGMYNDGFASPTLTNFTFEGNSTDQYGGGMSNQNGARPVLTNGTFSHNTAQYGGGMFNSSSNPILTNCTFSGNSATIDGGGMYNTVYSSPNLTDCTFSGNSALGGNGGGMTNMYSSPTLTNITFSGNLASSLGGGMFNHNQSSPEVKNCFFNGNSAASGGGMYNNSYSNPKLMNTSFIGNSAALGGALFNNTTAPQITNCTFFGNTADATGGGMYNLAYPAPVVENSILWGDTPDEIYNSDSNPVVAHSDVQGGYSGDGNFDVDPAFVDPVNSDFHLSAGSPVIDAGSNSAPNLPEFDFEGDPRILDGNGDGTAIVDMGVDEYNPESSAGFEGTLNPNIGWPYYSYGLASLRGQFIAILAGVGFTALMSGITRRRSARNIKR